MPEFFAEHTPRPEMLSSKPELAAFMRGYFDCAEWLWPERDAWGEDSGIDRAKVRGWSVAARQKMKADCRAFFYANRRDIRRYCELRGGAYTDRGYSTLECAGHDFFLTREGHGAGFWDRGNDAVFSRLSDASRPYGEYGAPWLSRGFVEI